MIFFIYKNKLLLVQIYSGDQKNPVLFSYEYGIWIFIYAFLFQELRRLND
jgi:hypothetical protein